MAAKELNFYPVFNKSGRSGYYLDKDKTRIWSWEGKPVGFVEKGAIFNYKKQHKGFYLDGWVRDKEGKCVGFVEPGKGGPNPPKTRLPADPPAEKPEPPDIPEIEENPDKPPRRPVWSPVTDDEMFGASKTKRQKK